MAHQKNLQLSLRLSPVSNSELFSNHWLQKRLPLEPEWNAQQEHAIQALEKLLNLWREQQNRVEQYGSEPGLEQAFIQPVLQALGWKLIYQTHLRGRKPDYALFLNDASLDSSLKAGRLNPEFWKFPTILADAKAWHVPLDRPTITGQQKEYPPEQIEWYLNNSQLDYAILTNGKIWRLIPREHDAGQPRFQTYFECDLVNLLKEKISEPTKLPNLWKGFDDFMRFFLFFSPVGFIQTLELPSLIERARRGSGAYRIGVGEGLQGRVFEALRLCTEGFISDRANGLKAGVDLETSRFNSLVFLYRLLFILYAEDRKLLPFGVDKNYTQNRSLGRLRDDIAERLERIEDGREPDYSKESHALWEDLSALFSLIDEGAPRYKVPPYNGGLFDGDEHPFLKNNFLPDWYLARIIDQLGRAEDLSHGESELVRVDYRDLAIQHLGNLYEGLLELQPHYASEDMVEVRSEDSKDERQIIPAASPLPKNSEPTGVKIRASSVYLLSSKRDRRASGSYYTPNQIVDYIVENTLAPLCEGIDKALLSEINAAEKYLERAENDEQVAAKEILARLRKDFANRVLKIRILDPAMGSGHFLIRACQYVAEQIATNPNTHDPAAGVLVGDESILTYWKRRVAENCLYGVDKNFMAVELAKLALWLETIAVSQPLTFLDHHFRHGDSLVGASFLDLKKLPGSKPLLAQAFERQLDEMMPALLTTLSEIRSLPSTSVQQVKQKAKLFRDKCENVRKPVKTLADIWTATFFLDEKDRLTLAEYVALVEQLSIPSGFAALLRDARYNLALTTANEEVVPFHWQIEFPEIFATGSPQDVGFDVVLGNPPYDVLSEKETGQDLSGLKEFIKYSAIYKPSASGKNNLYKLFICRALSLLDEDGYLGFITPMPLLGDEQAIEIRKEIFRLGTFSTIEAFPQKDDPARRVFRDAKLSTVIVIARKTSSDKLRGKAFRARVHPGNLIRDDSPSLILSAADVPLYDPSNLTIVSCSQDDWNLAVRLMQSGRFQRLSACCTSYQGEVNETTDASFLSSRPEKRTLVLRGSNISLYALRGASQGEALYLSQSAFKNSKGKKSKAAHSDEARIGFQRSSPQNNFRRIVACQIPIGESCFDTVSYVPYSECSISPILLMALLNSKLLDWYFRLGSTNSKVNEYQFNNLPCPIFSPDARLKDRVDILKSIQQRQLDNALRLLLPSLKDAPFGAGVSETIVHAASKILKIEAARGEVSKHDRAALSPESQVFQDFIDDVLFAMAGFNQAEKSALITRLSKMS